MAALRCTCPPCLVCSLQRARARLHDGQLELADDILFQLVTDLRTYDYEPCRAATDPWQQVSELEEFVRGYRRCALAYAAQERTRVEMGARCPCLAGARR